MVQLVDWLARVQPLGRLLLMPAACSPNLFEECFLLAELLQQRFVREEEDILREEVGCVATLELLLGLARIDPLQDAQPPEVLQSDL